MEANQNLRAKLSLTAILVPDAKGGFTSFFAQFPNIIAEGDNETQAIDNLFSLVNNVFEYQRKSEVEIVKSGEHEVMTRSYEFANCQ